MRISLLVLALVGCGGGSDDSTAVTVHAANTKLAAVRVGDAWRPLALDGTGTATLEVDGPTQVMTVCDDPDFFDFYTIALGPGAEPLEMYCAAAPTEAARVAIAAPSSTQVFIGFRRAQGGGAMTLGAGTYDVIAVDTTLAPARFELRRDVALAGDATLTFDLAASGIAMTKVPVTIANVGAGELASPHAGFTTANRTTSVWAAPGSEAWILPASAIGDGDRHFVSTTTASETLGERSASHTVEGRETSIALALPPYIASATVTVGREPALAWQGDSRFDQLYFGINDPEFARLWDVLVLPSYGEAGGDAATLVIPDASTLPGWSSAWNLPAQTTDFEWFFSAEHETSTGRVSATRAGAL